MMTDDAFDKLLRAQEESAPLTYDTDAEWTRVSDTLYGQRRKRGLWWWLGGGLTTLVVLAFLFRPGVQLGAFPILAPLSPLSLAATSQQANTIQTAESLTPQASVYSTNPVQTELEEMDTQLAKQSPSTFVKTTDLRNSQVPTASYPSTTATADAATKNGTPNTRNNPLRQSQEPLLTTANSSTTLQEAKSAEETANVSEAFAAETSALAFLPHLPLQPFPLTEQDLPDLTGPTTPATAAKPAAQWSFLTYGTSTKLFGLGGPAPVRSVWTPGWSNELGLSLERSRNNWRYQLSAGYLWRGHRSSSLAQGTSFGRLGNELDAEFGTTAPNSSGGLSADTTDGQTVRLTEQAISLSANLSRRLGQSRWYAGGGLRTEWFLPATARRSRLAIGGLAAQAHLEYAPFARLPLRIALVGGLDVLPRYPARYLNIGPRREAYVGLRLSWVF